MTYEGEVFQNIDNKNNSNISWKNIVNIATEAGEKVLGNRSRSTKKYSNEKIGILSKKQKGLRLLIGTFENIDRKAVLNLREKRNHQKQIKKEIELEKEKEQEFIIENIGSQKDDSTRMFATVRETKKRDSNSLVESPEGYVNSTK